MSPRMTTRSTGRPAVASRGGGTGRRASIGGGRTGDRFGDQGDVPDFSTINAQQLQNLLPTIIAQVGGEAVTGRKYKTAMPSMTTSGVMLGMFWRTMTDVFQKL
ncbi:hypothetical protein Tco_0862783 [Tanacetum coccineum]